MQLKIENGVAVVQDGKPVFTNAEGKDIPVDVPGLWDKIPALQGEAKQHREAKEALEAKFKAFEGLDPEAARKALETVSNLDAGKLMDAGKVDALRAEIAKSWEQKVASTEEGYKGQLSKAEQALKDKDASIHKLLVTGGFNSSNFIKEKTVLPPDVAAAYFGKHFEVEDNNGELRVVAKIDGNTLFSRSNPGQPASQEEAIEMLFERHPSKDALLKGAQGGSGMPANGGSGGAKSMRRAEFDKLDPSTQAQRMREGWVVTS